MVTAWDPISNSSNGLTAFLCLPVRPTVKQFLNHQGVGSGWFQIPDLGSGSNTLAENGKIL